ncbi:uncharacterized protein PAC_01001 [Phialocephala subalpina]|uniref:Uncharacterized protein n=1 Tax=Phialocephala subalpina TaxID=576137 RepID=A0A1L7WED5_9HELO|nr:uncharacterized protein PAC_01001 [Phialocephala subalpina]
MAPRKSEKSKAEASESEEENSLQNSPEQVIKQAKNILSKASSLISNYNNSRDTKRKIIEEEFEKRAKDIGRRIDKLYDAKKSRVTKSQKVLWDRLDTLNKKRQTLENTILTSMKLVETSTLNISSELIAMFEGRIDELEECSTLKA